MFTYFDKFFLKHQCGFHKSYMVQHCLLVMIEKMKEARDKNKVYNAVHIDLTNAFDCLKHDLFIAKLHAFGLDYKSLRVMYAYFNKSQKLLLITVKFMTLFLVFLKAQYWIRYYLI